jgi:hypothetical protein
MEDASMRDSCSCFRFCPHPAAVLALLALVIGCASSGKKTWGEESALVVPPAGPRVIAVAPAIDLSGQEIIDPLLQADIVFQQLGQVRGVTAVPVNRAAEVMASMRIGSIETADDAMMICDALGVDALIVPTITLWHPYNPPRVGASLTMFVRHWNTPGQSESDIRTLSRAATPGAMESMPRNADLIQASGVFDASAGSTRARLEAYASGRSDPAGPMGRGEYLQNMDRYSAFVWHDLIGQLLVQYPP